MLLVREENRFATIARLTDDLVTLGHEKTAKTVSKKRMIVSDEDAHGGEV